MTTFQAPDAFFTADFIGEPRRGEESATGAGGRAYPIIIYLDEADDQVLGVTFSDLRPLGPIPMDAFLDRALAGIAAQNGGTVASQQRVAFAGTAAVDGVITTADAVQHVRAALLPPGHGYTLSQFGPPGSPRSQEFERLLSSFRHLPVTR